MSKDEIICFATALKQKYGLNHLEQIAEDYGIAIKPSFLSPKIVKAYTFKPYENFPAVIAINSCFDLRSRKILLAHELGHALLGHSDLNHFSPHAINNPQEFEANLFAVAFLFDSSEFNMKLSSMDNYILKGVLDHNIAIPA